MVEVEERRTWIVCANKRQIKKLEIELAYGKGKISLSDYHKRYEQWEKAKHTPIPKPKKRVRLHTARNGKTPRVLRKRIKDGHRIFAFPDNIWKVRQPRKRRR